jgi:hypothetical protein
MVRYVGAALARWCRHVYRGLCVLWLATRVLGDLLSATAFVALVVLGCGALLALLALPLVLLLGGR